MAKRKHKPQVNQLTPEAQAIAKEAKLLRLKQLQERRENHKYLQALKGAESRLKAAQEAKGMAILKVEQSQKDLKEAEAHLDQVATEVAQWETEGVVYEIAMEPVFEGDLVEVVHKQNQLGVVTVTPTSKLVYGTALTTALKGQIAKVQKKDFVAQPRIPTEEPLDQELLADLDTMVSDNGAVDNVVVNNGSTTLLAEDTGEAEEAKDQEVKQAVGDNGSTTLLEADPVNPMVELHDSDPRSLTCS